ncbi:MAG: helix-turn-helix transcriptional regulator [Alphaproteobacteria bacterium]|nr:helix-turn-helix transcriptional regulator [Alphaproteobacteria bacterium]
MPAPDPAALREKAGRASELLKSMSSPHRLMVLCWLTQGERSVGELGGLIGLGQSALSQHLARLRRDGLVKTRRDRQTIYYSLDGEASQRVMKTLYEIYCRDA